VESKLKLQRQLSRKFKEKEYEKWVIVIPREVIENLGWKEGEELQEEIKDEKLIIRPKASKQS